MTKQKWNILVFPGGMENGLEIQKSLKAVKEIKLFSASAPVQNQAFYVYKNNALVRDIHEEGWVDDLNRVVTENHIDLIYPANSFVIDKLNAEKANIKTRILLPPEEILRITRSKTETIKTLKDLIPTPELFTSPSAIPHFPVFAKPDQGYGAQGAQKIDNAEQLAQIDFKNYVVQTYLPGREYTVDCLTDQDGTLLFSGARERSRVRMATSMHAECVDKATETLLRETAQKILSRIPIKGAWFFQVKENAEGVLRLMEIDVRIAGTMCFNRTRGINFPLLSIYLAMGLPIKTLINKVPQSLDRCLKNRYIFDYAYDTVYIDLDDTIVVHDQLNTEIIQFLFQCVNQKKRLVLLTKHLGASVKDHLRAWRIGDLFDEIVWLKEDESKADAIKPGPAIFIDDSFSQRCAVAEKCEIPTFDASMIEVLLDDRI